MKELIFVVEEAPEGGFVARALGASIFTEEDSLADLPNKVRDAVRCHFDEEKAPKVVRLHHVREEVIAVWGFPVMYREAISLSSFANLVIQSLANRAAIFDSRPPSMVNII